LTGIAVAMQLTNRALWTIERHLTGPLSLRELARACDVSPFHLAHAFGRATGRSVMQYVRERRLTQAAISLANGATDILELALAIGYGSHQAFTRAFRAQFGVPPEVVRRQGSTDMLAGALVPALDMIEDARPALESARLETLGALAFVGLSGRHTFAALQDIPAQWRRFMEHENGYAGIADRIDRAPVGITLPPDADDGFEYVCAAQVTPRPARHTPTPPGLTRLELPVRSYAVFPHRDHVGTIRGTYIAIWNEWLPAGGWQALAEPILERHNPTFDPRTGYGGLEIWIPVAGPTMEK
jgi:AraC family transcriptional regulator